MIVKTLIGKVSTESTTCSLTGDISKQMGLTGRLALIGGLTGKLASASTVHTEVYDGPYEATPMTVSQTLNTKEKYMNDNVSIQSIPYFDVGNTSGGSTVYIGTEIEFE